MDQSRILTPEQKPTAWRMSRAQTLVSGLAMAVIAAAEGIVLVWFFGFGAREWVGAALLACFLAPAVYAGCVAWWTIARALPSKSTGSEMLDGAVAFVFAAAAWDVVNAIMYGIVTVMTRDFVPQAVAFVVLPAIVLVGIAHRIQRRSFASPRSL